jgi:hypothetical protein
MKNNSIFDYIMNNSHDIISKKNFVSMNILSTENIFEIIDMFEH